MSHSAPETKAKLQKQNRTLSMIDWPGVVGKKKKKLAQWIEKFFLKWVSGIWGVGTASYIGRPFTVRERVDMRNKKSVACVCAYLIMGKLHLTWEKKKRERERQAAGKQTLVPLGAEWKAFKQKQLTCLANVTCPGGSGRSLSRWK